MGRRITLEERVALRSALGDVSTHAVVRLTGRVVAGVLLIEGAGAALLWLNWQRLYGPARAAYLAVFHSVSAFSNASFDLLSGSPDGAAGFPTDAYTLVTLAGLVVAGSLGMPVVADLAGATRGGRLSLHSRLTLIMAAVLLVGGTLALFVGTARPDGLFGQEPWPRRLLLAFFHSGSRTSGFVLQPLDAMAPANVLTLCALMFIGGAPVSTSGGITTSTAAVLMLAMWRYVQGHKRVVVDGRTIPSETVHKAIAIVVTALLLVVGVTWLLLLTQPATLAEAMFEAISAFATSGFTLGLTPRLDLFGRLLIAATMFWGRLGALTVVVALARPFPRSAIEYPEEQILIG
jgi:trk system potassium uptake protein TrkH